MNPPPLRGGTRMGGLAPPSYDPEQARLLEEFGIALRANWAAEPFEPFND